MPITDGDHDAYQGAQPAHHPGRRPARTPVHREGRRRERVGAARESGPAGAPASIIYLALQEHGVSHADCDKLVNARVGSGRLRRAGDLLFVAEGGQS